ncbi:MAG: hypothetical protein IKN23_04515 [Lactococcus sp.]|jgi:hypothetical protein|uniref:Uncharacterized protein n=1 Tax=Pseudolactococcus piscium MKFS47 TaxID=297352 RepID=A0A0D6DUF8_9LACT|nr:hypothetical protein [Lactococcus piscium]MBR6895309.1 hypothetical protein [Lactococcus sp.]CEN27552.1 Uncharacterized protein LACPI_0352 [Lactococcus piscium MKFS47]
MDGIPDVPTKAVFSIESSQIIAVLFDAYEDEQDKISEANERELLIQDPFYKFRKKR